MLGNIFDVFSRRKENKGVSRKKLTPEFRRRVLMLFRDTTHGGFQFFLTNLHSKISYLVGSPALTQHSHLGPHEDVFRYLNECEDARFLDAIEYALRLDSAQHLGAYRDSVIRQLNEFLNVDDLPYFVTETIWEEYIDETAFRQKCMRLREESKVLPKDSQVLHDSAIEPALKILRGPAFLNANAEFMAALEDFRHGRYGDCLTKCNSSYESVMKVICGQKGYGYEQGHTTAKLVKTISEKAGLDTFWDQPLLLVGTLRNRLSTSHGAGEVAKVVPEHYARFAINMTASVIVFLHDHAYRAA